MRDAAPDNGHYVIMGAPPRTGDMLGDRFDRSYLYDHAGRFSTAYTGARARGWQAADGIHQESFAYHHGRAVTDFSYEMRARLGGMK